MSTVTRIDRERSRNFRFEVTILEIKHRRFYRMRVERTRIDLKSLFNVGGRLQRSRALRAPDRL